MRWLVISFICGFAGCAAPQPQARYISVAGHQVEVYGKRPDAVSPTDFASAISFARKRLAVFQPGAFIQFVKIDESSTIVVSFGEKPHDAPGCFVLQRARSGRWKVIYATRLPV